MTEAVLEKVVLEEDTPKEAALAPLAAPAEIPDVPIVEAMPVVEGVL